MSKPAFRVTVRAEPNDSSPEHEEKTFGYAPGFAKAVREMQRTHSRTWAWCTVAVTVRAGRHESTQYLGGCCYESRQDFIDNSGYYDDMVREGESEIMAAVRADHAADTALLAAIPL